MLKISDFSQLGQVSVRMLRHYDQIGLLKPAFVDPHSDYRYYALDQLPRLNRILALKDLGLSLEQIAQLLQQQPGVAELRSMLTQKQAQLEQELHARQAQLARVAARLQQIEREGALPSYEAVLKSLDAQVIASARQMVPAIRQVREYRYALFERLYGWLNACGVAPAGPELALYHNGEYVEEHLDIELAVVIDPRDARLLVCAPTHPPEPLLAVRELPPEPTSASVTHRGSLFALRDAFTALLSWIGANGYATSAACREIHLFGRENDQPGGDALVVEVQMPVQRP